MPQAVKALGYFRETVARPPRDGRAGASPVDSIADQSQAFLEFCKREGYQVAATFIEPAEPAGPSRQADGRNGAGDRPGFKQLLEYLKRHRNAGCAVVVAAVDQLGHDPIQAARCLFQIEGLGSRVVSLDGEADPAARLIEQWRDREVVVSVGERVREAMRKKAIRGEVLGRPPYGYCVGPKNRLEPVPDEANIVRYIFRLYTREGLGIRLIARRLNEEGWKTRRGGNWSMITIRDILLNRAYLGTYTRFGVRVPGSHPALISPDDYRRVQDRMASRRTSGGKRNLRQFLLSGLAYCGYCGNKMIGVSRRQTWTRRDGGGQGEAEYRYYQCLTRTNQSMCDYHTRRAADLEAEVRERALIGVERLLASPEAPDGQRPSVEEEVERLRLKLRQFDRQLEQYMQAAATQQLSRERLRELSLEVTQQRMETDDAIGQLEGARKIVETLGEQRRARATTLEALRSGWDALAFEQRRELVRELVERVTVLDDDVLVQVRS